MGVKKFFKNMLGGALIGVAMIIPGVSGGTVAVIMDIYDELIASVSGIFKHFKKSMAFLLPMLLGAVLAFAAAYIPLNFALERAPFPTVMLFAGLIAGSLPKALKDAGKRGFKKTDILSALIPFVVIVGICVLKLFYSAGDADLSQNMPVGGYFALFGVAMLASCALVVPGISGSMTLMILGYYAPVLGLFKGLFSSFLHSFAALAVFAAGLVIGFLSIARLMKLFMDKFPRGTNWAITGFVLGSVPAIFIVFDYSKAVFDALQISVGAVLCVLGIIAAYALSAFAAAKRKDGKNTDENK